jgi:hypothetical protein
MLIAPKTLKTTFGPTSTKVSVRLAATFLSPNLQDNDARTNPGVFIVSRLPRFPGLKPAIGGKSESAQTVTRVWGDVQRTSRIGQKFLSIYEEVYRLAK